MMAVAVAGEVEVADGVGVVICTVGMGIAVVSGNIVRAGVGVGGDVVEEGLPPVVVAEAFDVNDVARAVEDGTVVDTGEVFDGDSPLQCVRINATSRNGNRARAIFPMRVMAASPSHPISP